VSQEPVGAQEAQRIREVYARRASSGREDRYTLFQPAHLFHAQSLERAIVRGLAREGISTLAGLRILDVGCSGGSWLMGLTRLGADPACLFGVDLREEALSHAEGQRAVAAGDHLPFTDASFDLVCQLTMMSSVLEVAMRRRIAREMLRVLRPGGIVLWYDFTVNPFNRDVAGVRLPQLRALFAGAAIRAEKTTLAPPITRLLARHAWLACETLEHISWLRTHVVATIRTAKRTDSP